MKYFVKADVLLSVRKRYGIPLSRFAEKIKVEPAIISDWEKNGAELSTSRMELIAKTVGCHWSVLLRDDPLPIVEQPKNRRVSRHRDGYTPATTTLVSYRESSRLLSHIAQSNVPKLKDKIKELIGKTSRSQDFDKASAEFRVLVNYTDETRQKLSSPKKVYDYLVSQLEQHGIFVSEQEFDTDDIRGFMISKGDTFLIAISSLDKFPASRLFTLLHEVGHILRGKPSSACDLHEVGKSADPIENEERFCDNFAASFLMPERQFLDDDRVMAIGKNERQLDNDALGRIAGYYRTSYLAVIRRMYLLKVISYPVYRSKYKEFYDEILPKILAKRNSDNKEIRLPKSFYINREIKKASRTFTEFVIGRYGSGDISSGEAKRLLGVDTGYLVEIEKLVGAGK